MGESETSGETVPGASDPAAAGGPNRVFVRALLLLLVASAVVLIVPLTPLAEWLESPRAAAHWIHGLSGTGALLLFAAMVVSVLFGVPRLLFCPVSGALFGFWAGLAFCIAATLTSYYLAFLFVRGTTPNGQPRRPLHPRLAFLQGDPGMAGVVLARLVPLPGTIPTLALAASGVGHGSYLLGSAVGLVPEAVPFVLVGSGGLHADASHVAQIVGAGFACVLVAWLLTRHVAHSLAGSSSGRVED